MAKDKLIKPSEGYFLAKRQVQESFDGRLQILDEKIESLRKEGNHTGLTLALMEKEIVEKMRSHFRNCLLWDTSLGD